MILFACRTTVQHGNWLKSFQWKHSLKRPFCIIFMLKKPCLKVQILQYKFLDWKWPPRKFIRFGNVTRPLDICRLLISLQATIECFPDCPLRAGFSKKGAPLWWLLNKKKVSLPGKRVFVRLRNYLAPGPPLSQCNENCFVKTIQYRESLSILVKISIL